MVDRPDSSHSSNGEFPADPGLPAGPGASADPGLSTDVGIPAIPVSVGALVFDRRGRLLILRPTYKSGWTIPGGVMEADGETPWQACQREVLEECGLRIRTAGLVCVDYRRPRPGRAGGLRLLFDCGPFDQAMLARIVLQPDEISDYRFARIPAALKLLRGPIRRRVESVLAAKTTVYLEEGRPVPEVR